MRTALGGPPASEGQGHARRHLIWWSSEKVCSRCNLELLGMDLRVEISPELCGVTRCPTSPLPHWASLATADSVATRAWESCAMLCTELCMSDLYWRSKATFLLLSRSGPILQCNFPYHQCPIWPSVWKANDGGVQIPEPGDWNHGKLSFFSVSTCLWWRVLQLCGWK